MKHKKATKIAKKITNIIGNKNFIIIMEDKHTKQQVSISTFRNVIKEIGLMEIAKNDFITLNNTNQTYLETPISK